MCVCSRGCCASAAMGREPLFEPHGTCDKKVVLPCQTNWAAPKPRWCKSEGLRPQPLYLPAGHCWGLFVHAPPAMCPARSRCGQHTKQHLTILIRSSRGLCQYDTFCRRTDRDSVPGAVGGFALPPWNAALGGAQHLKIPHTVPCYVRQQRLQTRHRPGALPPLVGWHRALLSLPAPHMRTPCELVLRITPAVPSNIIACIFTG